ncbi:MAG: GNAT family N-acetyltransferase [bacterium]
MIRRLEKKDRPQVESIVRNIEIFSDEEKDVAMELIDLSLSDEGSNFYFVFVYEEEGNILGYHCTGKRALTNGVYDLYWIVVDTKIHNKGIGKYLLRHSEEFALQRGGSLILAETSSRKSYDATRGFYERNNYSVLASIKNFYSAGDDLIVFGKYLTI